jgi:hypothetical protein
MLVFLAGAVAGVIILIVVAILVTASSGTSRQPYGGTPAYHPSRQQIRIGAVSYSSDWQQTTLTRSLEVKTDTMCLNYTVSGPPDAVLQDQPFMKALGAGMLQAQSGYADRGQIGSGSSRRAISDGLDDHWA